MLCYLTKADPKISKNKKSSSEKAIGCDSTSTMNEFRLKDRYTIMQIPIL